MPVSEGGLGQEEGEDESPLHGVWMDVEEIYDKMIEWDMRPVR